MDFDASRAPDELYYHLGLSHPEDIEAAFSKMEWDKNCTNSRFELIDGIVLFQAECTSMQVEHEIRAYMDWFQKEVDECNRALSGRVSYWGEFQPPYKIVVEIEPDGYKSGPFCLTMEQDRILELLAGKNLYNNPGVFVRELLQNAIDAIQTRVLQDASFQLEEGRIFIHTWMDNDGYSWFRIEDNGTGMDQDIILNYFLKVGSSYYSSERFKVESRKYKSRNNYTPISRFGIGILSCFMSDPMHNKLQLSTKRFAQVGSLVPAAIRMNVDGLHGYYYLAEEKAQATESSLLPMNHPPIESDVENCYRKEPGTTVCVRLNLYQLGGCQTLKELVDQYVQFPEIRVEYYGPEGHFVYPTQQELMREVHSLNPDGEGQPPKEHYYRISDENFAKLKKDHPEIVWETDEKPGIALKYCPLDWMAPGDQVSGVAVLVKVVGPKCHISWQWPDENPSIHFYLSYNKASRQITMGLMSPFAFTFHRQIGENIRYVSKSDQDMRYALLHMYPSHRKDTEWLISFSEKYKVKQEEIPLLYREVVKKINDTTAMREKLAICNRATEGVKFCFPYAKLLADYPLLNALPDYLQQCGQASVESQTIVAFNGILVDQSQFLGGSGDLIGMVLLLRQNYRPEVKLARDTISELPLEAAAVLSVLQRKLGLKFEDGVNPFFSSPNPFLMKPDAFQPTRFLLKTEKEIQTLLDDQPALKDELRFDFDVLYEDKQSVLVCEVEKILQDQMMLPVPYSKRDSLYDILCLAAIKQIGTVTKKFNSNSNPNLYSTTNDNITASFPVTLFFAPEGESASFGTLQSDYTSYYNREHPFSRWLIVHQKSLLEKVPGIYNILIEYMVMITNKVELISKLNDELKRLQNILGNPFEITDNLFLEESDFT